MWSCKQCGEQIDDQFDSCWRCSLPKGEEPIQPAPPIVADAAKVQESKLAYRIFRGTLATWAELFAEAAAFGNEVGPEHLVSISHSADDGDGVVTVWYWTVCDEEEGA